MDTSKTPIVPITDFIRNSKMYLEMLPMVEELVLTKDSYDVAYVRSSPKNKNERLSRLFGAWKGTALDSDKLWESILKRRNKKAKYTW